MIVHGAVAVTCRRKSHSEQAIVPLERYSRHLEFSALRKTVHIIRIRRKTLLKRSNKSKFQISIFFFFKKHSLNLINQYAKLLKLAR